MRKLLVLVCFAMIPFFSFAEDFITIKAVGDIVSYSDYPAGRFYRPKSITNLLDNINPYLGNKDLLIGNLEGVITKNSDCAKDHKKSPFVFAFRFPPVETESLLKTAGFDAVHIANNHMCDFGERGLLDTERYLKSAGIESIGLKNKITYIKMSNVNVAMIGAMYSGWVFNDMHRSEALVSLVQEARTNADIVLVTMHAGAEGAKFGHVNRKEEVFLGERRGNVYAFAHHMIDSGADAVIGSGPHVLRGIEVYKGKLIAYSLGNFLAYGGTLARGGISAYSGILEMKLSQKGDFVSGKIIPAFINEEGIPVFDEKKRAIGLIKSLSEKDFPESEIEINEEGEILILKQEK
jgi:hypothetical protein